MTLSLNRRIIGAVLVALVFMIGNSDAATTLTPFLHVDFDGTLSGTAYTPAPGEIVPSTFVGSGAVSISGGVADVPGDVNGASGFWFNASPLATPGIGTLPTSNWVSEAIYYSDANSAGQPTTQGANHILDVAGEVFYRYDNFSRSPKSPTFGFWDGANEVITDSAEPTVGVFTHVALVWDSATNELEAFLNGVSQGIASTGSDHATAGTNVGYGFFSRAGFMNRAVDGKLDAVAFSKFTGTFDPSTDFQLDVVPEPGAGVLAVATILTGLWGGRARDCKKS